MEGAVRALIESFVAYLEDERALSEHTVRAYRGDLERFVDFLATDFFERDAATLRPEEVDALAIRSHLAALARRGASRRTQGRALAAVRACFRWACRVGLLSANPAARVRTPKTPKTLPGHLRPGEVETLIEAPAGGTELELRDRALLELLYATGLRVSEAVSLDWRDLDLGGRTLRVLGKGARSAWSRSDGPRSTRCAPGASAGRACAGWAPTTAIPSSSIAAEGG